MEFTLSIEKKAQARINPGRCINCGECKRICPTDAINEYQKAVSGLFSSSRGQTVDTACSVGCPLGIIPQTVASFIKQGEASKAYRHIAERTPLPWICSEVCDGPCYNYCKLINLDEDPVDMHALEKAAMRDGKVIPFEFTPPTYDKIAIIGAGPAGVMAAFELRRLGYRPVIFEKRDRLGGAMGWGISDQRLDKKAMHLELDRLIATGIDVRYNYVLGENFGLDQIWREDFAACLIATGNCMPVSETIRGAECRGVYQAMDILRESNDGGYSEIEKRTAGAGMAEMGEKIVVVGRGSLVPEVVTVLAGAGKEVTVIYDGADDPKVDKTIESLTQMGVTCRRNASVRQVISDPAGVKAVEVVEEDRATNIFCDGVILAFGRRSEVEHIGMVETSAEGTVQVDGSFRTNRDRIYACGEVAGCRESIVEAMAQGRRAAFAIDRDLRKTGKEGVRAEFYPASSGETIYPQNLLTDRDYRAIGTTSESSIEDIVSILRTAGLSEDMPVYFKDEGPVEDSNIKKVAIVGGGLAGISAAIAFAKRGVRPTIFEKTSRLGGSCRWLATNRRYDRERMDLEMAKLEYSGIRVMTDVSAGVRPDLMDMLKDFDAVLLAMGETAPAVPGIEGADARGAFDVVSLMSHLNNGQLPEDLGRRVVVVGSDDTTLDIARALKRLCEEVTVASVCGKGKLQVTTSAGRQILEEGINLVTGVEVTGIETKNGAVDTVMCNVISRGSSLGIPCDTVVFGEGKKPDLETLSLRNLYLDLDEDGYVKTNTRLATNMRGVYAIGDFNMTSIDAGKAGAVAVMNYLFGENESIVVDKFRPEEMAVEHERIEGKTGVIAQQEVAVTQVDEGERCIGCGYHQPEENRCIGCGICQKYCPTGAIWMEGIEE